MDLNKKTDQMARINHNLGVVSLKNEKYEDAFSYFSKSASLGFIESVINLGYLHFYGLGTHVNYQEALRLYQVAANRGSKEAEYTVENIKSVIRKQYVYCSQISSNPIEVRVSGNVKEGDILVPSGNNDGKVKKKEDSLNELELGKASCDMYEKNGNLFTKIIK